MSKQSRARNMRKFHRAIVSSGLEWSEGVVNEPVGWPRVERRAAYAALNKPFQPLPGGKQRPNSNRQIERGWRGVPEELRGRP